jgi:hypothetical protein
MDKLFKEFEELNNLLDRLKGTYALKLDVKLMCSEKFYEDIHSYLRGQLNVKGGHEFLIKREAKILTKLVSILHIEHDRELDEIQKQIY